MIIGIPCHLKGRSSSPGGEEDSRRGEITGSGQSGSQGGRKSGFAPGIVTAGLESMCVGVCVHL